jgi:DNA-binding MarR family transcriptional regulator
VSGRLAREIKQTKPFALLEEEAVLNLGRTHEYLQQRLGELLKEFQLTPTQYNMLRILRGAGSEGVTCSQACERMISPDPDITRLLDRMEARKLLVRDRSKQDRRVVISCITPEGLELVNRIDQPLTTMLKRYLGHLGKDRLKTLIDTLELLRDEPA